MDRVRSRAREEGCASPVDLVPLICRDDAMSQRLAEDFSVPHSTMFRRPDSFRRLTETAFSWLKAYPDFKIWHAGCASGEEVLSLAILLKEAGLYERSTIYATDMSAHALSRASLGVYEASRAPEFAASYTRAGGQFTLAEYFSRRGDHIVFDRSLFEQVTFAYNLATGGVFNEFNLVVCRNVMITSGQLRRRSLAFLRCLAPGGYLFLGECERISDECDRRRFEAVSSYDRIYRRTKFIPDVAASCVFCDPDGGRTRDSISPEVEPGEPSP